MLLSGMVVFVLSWFFILYACNLCIIVFFFFNDTATPEIYTYDTLFPYTTLFRSPNISTPGSRRRCRKRRPWPGRNMDSQGRRSQPLEVPMPAAAANRPVRRWRPNGRLWPLLGAFITGCVVLQALAEWRDKHLFLINTTHFLPNWAFLIDRGRMAAKGEFIFFRSVENTSEVQSLIRT